jgi:hypothetical protein
MEAISVETVPRGGNCLFQRFRSFGAIEVIHYNMKLLINPRDDYKMYSGKH